MVSNNIIQNGLDFLFLLSTFDVSVKKQTLDTSIGPMLRFDKLYCFVQFNKNETKKKWHSQKIEQLNSLIIFRKVYNHQRPCPSVDNKFTDMNLPTFIYSYRVCSFLFRMQFIDQTASRTFTYIHKSS